MARATYLAPGVYVEEVPSAQQPITGIGTNTVGFIGIVADEIQYPVPNEDYDPVLARKVLEGAGAIEADKKEIEGSVQRLQDQLKQAQDAMTQIDQRLAHLVMLGRGLGRQRLERAEQLGGIEVGRRRRLGENHNLFRFDGTADE